MTTLPQTAPIRLPRTLPVGPMPGQLGPMPTLGHPMFPAGPHAGGPPMGAADILRVVRANFWLILITLILFGVGGYLVNRFVLLPHYSRYQSTALLRVTTTNEATMRLVDPLRATESYETAIRQEAV